MRYIIDSYAWIEYLTGSKEGQRMEKLFADMGNKFVTMECCVAEILSYCLRNNIGFNGINDAINKNSFIFHVLREHWIEGAKIRFEMRKKIKGFGLIDAVLIAKQREINAEIITGDPHFKGLKSIVYIGD